MCELVWSEAQALYTNDTQRLYSKCQDISTLLAPWCWGSYVCLSWAAACCLTLF